MEKQEAIHHLLNQGVVPTQDRISELITIGPALSDRQAAATNVEILESHDFKPCKLKTQDFVAYFRNRYSSLKNMLLNRPEASTAVSISRAKQARVNNITVIAMISDIKKLPTGTYRLEIEDLTDRTVVIISKNSDALEKVKYLTYDEVVALHGSFSKKAMFVNDITWPDIPMTKIPSCSEEVYVAFSSDVHIGSKMFLKDNFEKFISWLRGEFGNELQKSIAQKVKYVLFIGDVVDGVGIYPGQQNELNIIDLGEQFQRFADYLKQIPKDKEIILCPGNHDSIRIGEPQPKFSEKWAAPLYEMDNVTIVSNPAYLKIHRTENFPGLNVLIYHGYSFDYYANRIEILREQGGYDSPDKIMEYLVKKRHLAPTYSSTLLLPMKFDPLLISKTPHVLATGHIHKAKISKYKEMLLIASSCWQAKTSFQEKVGHHPEPCFVPILNLKTKKASMLDFS